MTTEVWYRNPHSYIKEMVEVGVTHVAWDRGSLVQRSIDPQKHAMTYYPRDTNFQILVIGDPDQGAALLDREHSMSNPLAVFPVWEYGQEMALLEEMIARNVGADIEACADATVPVDERPVLGQEHVVVVTGLPVVTTGLGRQIVRHLHELQEEYPATAIYLHGLYSWRVQFGMGFKKVDVEPRTAAQKGKVIIPPGRELRHEETVKYQQWIHLLGMTVPELEVPRNRCIYNIKSAEWAGQNYDESIRFKSRGWTRVNPDSPTHLPATTNNVFSSALPAKAGDKFHCDTCSLSATCKYYRSGAVCSIPDSEPAELARQFKTRDSDLIINGLGTLMEVQTGRLQQGLHYEEIEGELDPEVTKIIGQLFQNGVKLAKLVNPALAAGPKVQVNVGAGGAAAVSAGTPQQLVAGIVRALEEKGIPRDKITPAMIEKVIQPDPQVIEASAIEASGG